ncbi:MAG TPA: tetratricopeptide repeat protein [Pyrinomonadaceae bacterium]|nr:tetratricopeptide repeat protein [Pyrinomonadaceae bacterium]
MNRQECPRARSVRALLLVLIAIFAASAASCTNPETAKANHVSRGEAYLKERKWQEAVLEFRNATQIDDKLAAAHWGLAQAYEQLGRGVEAFEALQKTVQLDPANSGARLKLANAYIIAYDRNKNQEFIAQAERLASEILAQDEKNVDGQILMANVLHLKGDSEAALAKLKYAISLNPERIESHIGLAKFFIQTNRPADAEATFKQAVSINDRSSLAHIELAKFYAQTRRTDEAEAHFRRAAEVDPENRDVRWVLASFYLLTSRLDKAEEAYKAWAQLDWEKPEGKARLADYYATVGRYDEAANLYQEIVSAAPDYTRGRYRLGEISLQRGDTKGAAAQADELLKRNDRDLDALFLRARMRLNSGKVKDSIADLKTVLEQDPRSELGLYFMSEALYRDGQLEQARGRVGELERFHPNFLPAKLVQIQINFESGDAAGAKRMADELLARLAQTAPDGRQTPQLLADVKVNAYILRGKANLRLKQAAAARADFEAARNISPNSPNPHVNLAEAAFAEGKRDEAAQHLDRALAIDRANFQAISGLINLSNVEKRLDAARARIEQLVAEQPSNAQLHYLLGSAYRVGNDVQPPDAPRSEQAFRRATELDPDYIAAYTALAEIYFAQQRPDDAVAQYGKIAERRPDDAVAYRNIGMIESGRKNHDAAEQFYRRALSVRPDEPIAANNLAMLYADYGKGNPDEAMRLAQEVVRRFPDEPGFADTLGWVYHKKGLHAAAVEQLDKAVKGAAARGGDNSLYRYHLGMALAARGDKARARAELQKCLQLAAAEEQRPVKAPTTTPLDEVRRTLESL